MMATGTTLLSTMLSTDQVSRLIGVCPNTVRSGSKSGEFPKPVAVGGLRRWRVEDIEAWEERLGRPRT